MHFFVLNLSFRYLDKQELFKEECTQSYKNNWDDFGIKEWQESVKKYKCGVLQLTGIDLEAHAKVSKEWKNEQKKRTADQIEQATSAKKPKTF